MRKDYKYIEKATALVMCVTTIGSDYVDELYNDDSKIDNVEGLDELLLYLEDNYLILKNGSTIGDWVDKINEDFADNYHSKNTTITREHILEGIKNGWIGFKTVIWDEGVQIGKEEEIDVFRITIPTKETVKFIHNDSSKYTKQDKCSVFKKLIQYTANKNIKLEQLVDGDYTSKKKK